MMTNRWNPSQVFRAEVVGSLLRPARLLEARSKLAAGVIGPVEFKRIEDEAVDEAVALQERLGLDVITDGEFRRQYFASQIAESCDGFAAVTGNYVDWFDSA